MKPLLTVRRNPSPYNHLVPKDVGQNLQWRANLIRQCAGDKAAQYDAKLMCSRDPLFFVNSFAFTYNPKRKGEKVLPFITWSYQDVGLQTIERCVGVEDVLIEKSRDMGASWLCLIVFFWRWMFKDMESFLMVSRKEDLVDKKGDPKSLFWKMDFLMNKLPKWMIPAHERKAFHLENFETGSTINGESTTGDVARGDRRTAILLDEFAMVDNGDAVEAATQDASDSRIFNSTYKGVGNAFHKRAQMMRESGMKVLRFHWSEHPEKAKDLTLDEGGLPTSPWYKVQCARAIHAQQIAQELDINPLGSDFQFFEEAVLARVEEEYCRPPYVRGDIRLEQGKAFIQEGDEPFLKLWLYPDAHGNFPEEMSFVMGVDLSWGLGSSNSAISIVNRDTGEKVGAYVHSRMAPDKFADLAFALGKLFKGRDEEGAFIIWEANGPGQVFGQHLVEHLKYPSYYMRRDEVSLSRNMSDRPGWWSGKDLKRMLLGDYKRALSDGKFINRDKQAIQECREWIFTKTGMVEHAKSVNSFDPSGAKENHGDRTVADALCWRVIQEALELPLEEEPPEDAPVGSYAWRMEQRKKERELAGEVSRAGSYW